MIGKMNKKDFVILLDLGGVLIELNWLTSARKLFGQDQNEKTLKKRWSQLVSVKKFESGKTDLEKFYEEFSNETDYWVPFDRFKLKFASIIGPLKAECKVVLAELKRDFKALAMLSNTNYLHIAKLKKETDLLTSFDHLFFSYDLGMAKPDHEIFYEVAARLRTKAAEIIFFDDSPLNVNAAKDCGINAFRVDGPAEILAELNAMNLK